MSHTLALELNENSSAQEIAAENGLVRIVFNVLQSFNPPKDTVKLSVPKWVTALLLVLDHLLQYKVTIHADALGGAATAVDTSSCVAVKSNLALSDGENPEVEFERDKNLLVAILWRPTGYMTTDKQCRTTAVVTSLLHMQLPSATAQAVLQLCAQLTKIHTIALQFLDAGGLTVLLILSRSSM
jgi:E3 ubiquitin-protein ligase HUWE1